MYTLYYNVSVSFSYVHVQFTNYIKQYSINVHILNTIYNTTSVVLILQMCAVVIRLDSSENGGKRLICLKTY